MPCFNPCYSGSNSKIKQITEEKYWYMSVSILVIVEVTLKFNFRFVCKTKIRVSILVIVEVTLKFRYWSGYNLDRYMFQSLL